jgi:hypothetical protein
VARADRVLASALADDAAAPIRDRGWVISCAVRQAGAADGLARARQARESPSSDTIVVAVNGPMP